VVKRIEYEEKTCKRQERKMKVDESVAKLKKGDLVRSIKWGWIGTIIGFEEANSNLYGGKRGLLPIIFWSHRETNRPNPYRVHPKYFEVINENR